MEARDPVDELVDDHRHLTELVTLVRAGLNDGDDEALLSAVEQLQDELIRHTAREEEGLFPFVTEHAPALEPRARALQDAHDTICGIVTRLLHTASLVKTDRVLGLSSSKDLFARFEASYVGHARVESAFLRDLGATLNEQERNKLRAVLLGL